MASSPRGSRTAGPFQEMAFMALDIEDGHESSTGAQRIHSRDPEYSSLTDSRSVSVLHSAQAVLRSTTEAACSPASSRQYERCENSSNIMASGLVTGRASGGFRPRAGSSHLRAEEAHEPAQENESEPLLPSEPPSLLDEQPSVAVKGDGWRGGAEEDDFYRLVYRYYCARGLWCMTMSVRKRKRAGFPHLVSVTFMHSIAQFLHLLYQFRALHCFVLFCVPCYG